MTHKEYVNKYPVRLIIIKYLIYYIFEEYRYSFNLLVHREMERGRGMSQASHTEISNPGLNHDDTSEFNTSDKEYPPIGGQSHEPRENLRSKYHTRSDTDESLIFNDNQRCNPLSPRLSPGESQTQGSTNNPELNPQCFQLRQYSEDNPSLVPQQKLGQYQSPQDNMSSEHKKGTNLQPNQNSGYDCSFKTTRTKIDSGFTNDTTLGMV